jgi:hypothetical protein
MNRTELTALPAVVDVSTAAQALGLGKTAAYELIRCGQWPTPVLRLGKSIRIPTAPLLALLGLPSEVTSDSSGSAHAAADAASSA